MRLRPLLFLLLAGFLGKTAATAAQPQPVAFVQAAIDDTLAAAYDPTATTSLEERIKPVVTRFFSFEAITRRAVGPGWRMFSPEQQKRAVELFTAMVIRSYSARFDPAQRPTIRYAAAADLDRGRKEVPTSVTYGGQTYAVTYRLEPAGDSWLVYDVVAEGVSLVANYRAQFEAIFNRGGAQAVLKALETTTS